MYSKYTKDWMIIIIAGVKGKGTFFQHHYFKFNLTNTTSARHLTKLEFVKNHWSSFSKWTESFLKSNKQLLFQNISARRHHCRILAFNWHSICQLVIEFIICTTSCWVIIWKNSLKLRRGTINFITRRILKISLSLRSLILE